MNLNILKPCQAVESAFQKPSILLALVLVLLPAIASIAGKAAYGIPFSENSVYQIALAYVSFFALVLVAFALGLLVDREKAKSKFLGLFSALSLIQIVQLVSVIVSLLALPLILSPQTIQFAMQAAKSANQEMVAGQVNQFIASNPTAVNWLLFPVFIAIGIVLLLWGAYILYKSLAKLTESKPLTALILTVIAFIIIGALPI